MDRVTICEMSPRDGLQALGGPKEACRLIPLERKLALIDALVRARLPYIEVGSFVSSKALPQMADMDELAQRLTPADTTEFAALVPNLKHYERFRRTTLRVCALFVSASEEYSRRNMNASLAETLGWAWFFTFAAALAIPGLVVLRLLDRRLTTSLPAAGS